MQEVNQGPKSPPKKPLFFYYIIALIAVFLLNALLFPTLMQEQVVQVSYDQFLSMVDAGEVTEVALDETNQQLVFVTGTEQDRRFYKTGIWPDDGQRLLQQLRDNPDITFEAEIPTQANPLLSFILT